MIGNVVMTYGDTPPLREKMSLVAAVVTKIRSSRWAKS